MFRISISKLVFPIVIKITFFLIVIHSAQKSFAQTERILVGAELTELYLKDIQTKRIAVVANQTSRIRSGNKYIHLIDTLISMNINVKKVFAPEHGFRGIADAGEKVSDGIDIKTGLPIITLYGENRKPSKKNLEDIDIVIFDIQDVGARFYTYISTMHMVMESVAENNKKIYVLDRPNPNGHYVDGPILDMKFKSFVGMHPVPIVHGMTVGEFAMMINEEGWLRKGIKSDLKVIPLKNYDRKIIYDLPIKPSPNLPNKQSINLYPSLCFFEQTDISIGRGTNMQFQIFGDPNWDNKLFSFTPKSMSGAKFPKHQNTKCYGFDLSNQGILFQINLEWLIFAYNNSKDKLSFFKKGFVRLAGDNILQKQIEKGKTANQIRDGWKKGIKKFKNLRKNYLLYD